MAAKGKWSARAELVARWFDVDASSVRANESRPAVGPPPDVELSGGKVVLVCGPSGAGKSTLLGQLRRRAGRRVAWTDLGRVRLPQALVIDAMADALGGGRGDDAIVTALEALSRVGLGEVWTYLRTAEQLSEGQRWRLRLALALARATAPRRHARTPSAVSGRTEGAPSRAGSTRFSKPPLTILAADEFAAPLDPVTAHVVARALRKAVNANSANLCAIVATARPGDLARALQPDLTVRCDFGTVQLFPERRPS
jgi:hypothetical protein